MYLNDVMGQGKKLKLLEESMGTTEIVKIDKNQTSLKVKESDID
jgi:hypothetical protein